MGLGDSHLLPGRLETVGAGEKLKTSSANSTLWGLRGSLYWLAGLVSSELLEGIFIVIIIQQIFSKDIYIIIIHIIYIEMLFKPIPLTLRRNKFLIVFEI